MRKVKQRQKKVREEGGGGEGREGGGGEQSKEGVQREKRAKYKAEREGEEEKR